MFCQRILWIGVCVTLVLCFQGQAVIAQEASSKSFYRSSFYPRLPDFEPLKNLNLNNPKTAILQLGSSQQDLTFFWGQEKNKKETFWIINRTDEFTTIMSGFMNAKLDRGVFHGEVDLKSLNYTISSNVLEIQVLPEQNVLMYRTEKDLTLKDLLTTQKKKPGRAIGDVLGNFLVETLDGEQLQLEELIGKIVVINVWFTTCPPCIEEIPHLNQLVEKYRHDSSFVFLAVAKNSKEELATFLKNRSFNYIQALSNSDFDTLLGGSYPRNIIVDKGGVVAYDRIGGNKRIYEELDDAIQELKTNQR
ncbi:MAG: TlpA disulfide reductase family protein [Gemmatimonadetes bacterium]|nr:TlpA disulfide reductase family protein [Gemmatimonadota bacterium]